MIRINAYYGISEFNETNEKKTAARRERFKMVQDLIFISKSRPAGLGPRIVMQAESSDSMGHFYLLGTDQ
jgi:hypothetical protein